MDFSQKLTLLRKKHGLSQEKLAEKLDVSRQSVFKWESGENTPDIEKIIKLAKLFNVTLDSLLIDEKDIEEERNVQPIEPQKKSLSKKGFIAIISASVAVIALSVATAIVVPNLVKDETPVVDTLTTQVVGTNTEVVLDDTSDEDSTRSIVLSELNGEWESNLYRWTIEDKNGFNSVLTSVYVKGTNETYNYVNAIESSVLYGYGMGIQKKSGSLANGTSYLSRKLDIYLTKSKDGVIKLYCSDEVFKKI